MILVTAAACFGGVGPGCGSRPAEPDRTEVRVAPTPISSPYLNARPGVAYVGDAACSRCHADLSESFRRHPMGRSATTPAGVKPDAVGPVFEVGDLAYSIERRDGRVFHRETRRGGAEGAPAVTEAEVRYVIGSGIRGYSFLVERGDGLYQSPIAWYAHGGRWDLPPGYREQNQHFGRRITAGCLYCHTNRFDTAESRPPVFHGLAIGCERCHGPGELHARQAGPAGGGGGPDRTIVNPAKLEPALREAVCEQCHFQGSDRSERPGRSLFDFRPGLPLDEFVMVFTHRSDPFNRSRAVGHVEEMRLSRCYRESGGRLGCISCHDPHRLPEPAERVAFYRGHCLNCHADRGCSMPRPARLARAGRRLRVLPHAALLRVQYRTHDTDQAHRPGRAGLGRSQAVRSSRSMTPIS